MMVILLISSVLFAVAFGVRNSYQLKEFRYRMDYKILEANEANKRWHIAQGVIQVFFFTLVSLISSYTYGLAPSLLIGLLGAGIFWIVFDGIVNVFGLGVPFFYVGTTAAIDVFFQKFSKPKLMMALSKLFLIVILSIIIYNILNKKL